MKLLITIAALLSLYSIQLPAQNIHFLNNPPPIYFDRPDVTQKVGVNNVTAIFKDSRGLMWFGTSNGLYRFDGSAVLYTRKSNGDSTSLPSNEIKNITEDIFGNMWIGTNSGGVVMNPYTLKCTSIKDEHNVIPGFKIGFFTDDKRTIWGATDDGLFKCDPATKQIRKVWDGTNRNNGTAHLVSSIGFYGDTLVLGTLTELVFVNRNNFNYRITPFFENGKEKNIAIYKIYIDENKEIWAGAWGEGLLHYEKNSNKLSNYKWEKDLPSNTDNLLSDIIKIESEEHTYLLVSCDMGLIKIPIQDGTQPDVEHSLLYDNKPGITNGLSAGAILCLYKDDIGNLWFGGNSDIGITKISITEPLFKTLNIFREGSIQQCEQIILGGKKYFCISNWHNKPALQILDSNLQPVRSFLHLPVTDMNPDAVNASAVSVDSKDRLWISTWRGVVVMDNKFNTLKIINRSLNSPDTLSRDKTNYLLVSDDTVWLASYKNGIDLFNISFKRLGHINVPDGHGLKDNIIWKFYKDHRGTIWLLGNSFFYKYDASQNKFIPYSFSSGNDVPGPVDVAERKDGTLLIATRNGLVHFDPVSEKFNYLRSPLLIKEDNINSVCTDEEDNAWFLTDAHLVKYDFASNNFILYGKEEGLDVSTGLQSIRYAGNNRFLLGMHTCFIVFTPRPSKNNTVAPKVLITGIKINDSSVVITDEPLQLELPYNQNRISFAFSAINYIRPEQNYFAYRIKSSDTSWTYTYDGSVSFANLSPGKYSFEVKVRNYEGVWSDSRIIKIRIDPPFWKTSWFITLVGLAFAGLFFAVIRYISQRNLKEKILRLEKEQAIEKERNRIARDMHDDLGSGLTKIAILSEVAKTQLQQPDKAKSQLENISVSSRELVDSLQDIIWVLNPKNDSLESLAAYIREYALTFFEPFGTNLKFNWPDEIPAIKLTEEQRRNIFLVIKESFNNIAKHAWCNTVIITLELLTNKISFTIEDDGKGFDIDNSRAFGNGLKNMKNRMQQSEGTFEIHSQPGKTITSLSIPV